MLQVLEMHPAYGGLAVTVYDDIATLETETTPIRLVAAWQLRRSENQRRSRLATSKTHRHRHETS